MERFRPLDFVGDVRHIGMVGAVELVRDKKTGRRFKVGERIGQHIFQEALKENLILRPLGDVIYLWLALSTTKRELNIIFDKVFKILKDLKC